MPRLIEIAIVGVIIVSVYGWHANWFDRLLGKPNFGTQYEMKNDVWSCYSKEVMRVSNVVKKAGSAYRYEAYDYLPNKVVDTALDGNVNNAIENTRPTFEKISDVYWDSIVNKGYDYQEMLWSARRALGVAEDELKEVENYIMATIYNCLEGYYDKKAGAGDLKE